jgi:hypothetical protein
MVPFVLSSIELRGMTDITVATMIGLTAVFVWVIRESVKDGHRHQRFQQWASISGELHHVGMPEDFESCPWNDCDLPRPHGHSTRSIRRYANATVWRTHDHSDVWRPTQRVR